uniref:Uncharacterized protein n=1 Tax=Romanomermis culicivorax TaxID=13658 RepID=A0A915L6P9_ROMCU
MHETTEFILGSCGAAMNVVSINVIQGVMCKNKNQNYNSICWVGSPSYFIREMPVENGTRSNVQNVKNETLTGTYLVFIPEHAGYDLTHKTFQLYLNFTALVSSYLL